MRTQQIAVLLATISVMVASGQNPARKCDPNFCRLPSCHCGGTSVPGNEHFIHDFIDCNN